MHYQKGILEGSLAFMQHFQFVNWRIPGLVFDVTNRLKDMKFSNSYIGRQILKTCEITKLNFKNEIVFWWNTWFFFSLTFRYKLLFWIQLKTLVSVIVFQNSFCTISLDMMMFWCLQSKVWLNMKTIKVFSGQYGFTCFTRI